MPRKKKTVPVEEPVSKAAEEEKPIRNEPFYYPKIKCEGCGEIKKSNQILMSEGSKKLICKDCMSKEEKNATQDSSV